MLYAVKPGPNGPQLRAIAPEKDLTDGEVAYSGPLVFEEDGITLDMAFDAAFGLRAKNDAEKLERIKEKQVAKIKEDHLAALSVGCATSLGITMDCTHQAVTDLSTFYLLHKAQAEGGKKDPVVLCDYSDRIHSVPFGDFEKIVLEVAAHYKSLYETQWAKRSAALDAATKEDVQKIKFAG